MSCDSYDKGFEDEAIRLATTMRVLLHDTGQSTSLLRHLGIKNRMYFICSAPRLIPTNMVSYTGLLILRSTVGEGGNYIHASSDGSPMPNFWLGFEDWWNQIVIDDKNSIFTRRDLVLFAANQDGGGHIDDSLTSKYMELTMNNSLGWQYGEGDIIKPFDNSPIYPSIRQIVHELLFSLEWNKGIKNYTRKFLNQCVDIKYIDKRHYIHRHFEKDDIGTALYKDDRVTNKTVKKVYCDDLIFKNGGRTSRNIVE